MWESGGGVLNQTPTSLTTLVAHMINADSFPDSFLQKEWTQKWQSICLDGGVTGG